MKYRTLRKLSVDAPLTNRELQALEQEIDLLNSIIDDDDNVDDDTHDSTIDRLEEIVEYIEKSIKITQMHQRGMKLVS